MITSEYDQQREYGSVLPSPYTVTPPYSTAEEALDGWAGANYIVPSRQDIYLLQQSMQWRPEDSANLADQVFGNQLFQERTQFKHGGNVLLERCLLHRRHLEEIQDSRQEIIEKLFGEEINHFPDRNKRMGVLEGQLLQLEQQRRDEELAFWKDSVELRQQLFESADKYRSASHRYGMFSGLGAADG